MLIKFYFRYSFKRTSRLLVVSKGKFNSQISKSCICSVDLLERDKEDSMKY